MKTTAKCCARKTIVENHLDEKNRRQLERELNRKEKNEYRKPLELIANTTPEQVARAIMKSPPKKEWRFMQKDQKPAQSD